MTRDIGRLAQGGHPEDAAEVDALAGLWEEAPFARLPADAPAELKDLVHEIENPKRVYAIHRASRRHNFQLLVEKYVIQLRNGCGTSTCTTPTCFSCRKRLVGKAPIRRYNTTSARTLAVYLASQDNPETAICPNLRPTRDPPATLNSLIFSPKQPGQTFTDPFVKRPDGNSRKGGRRAKSTSDAKVKNGSGSGSSPRESDTDEPGRQRRPSQGAKSQFDSTTGAAHASVKIAERPVSKDYRSFAANVFGTVAFRMLEWLTPSSVEAMSQKVAELQAEAAKAESHREASTIPEQSTEEPVAEPSTGQPSHKVDSQPQEPHVEPSKESSSAKAAGQALEQDTLGSTMPVSKQGKPRRTSSARVRATSATKSSRKLSIEPFPSSSFPDDIAPGLISPRMNGIGGEKGPRPPKNAHKTQTRGIPEIPSTPSFFDNVSSPRPVAPATVEIKPKEESETGDDELTSSGTKPEKQTDSHIPSTQPNGVKDDPVKEAEPLSAPIPEGLLPQSLSSLSVEVVDLVCNILQDDGTLERHDLAPADILPASVDLKDQAAPMKRTLNTQRPYPRRLKQQWKLFIEQSLFNILSDPHLLVKSFVSNDEIFDSHTLWYCMLRLTRVAPTLVFDSLWIAAASLFGAPKQLQSLRSPTTKVFRRPERSLSNSEAGRLMSICLHALVAAAPLVHDSRTLYDMARIRSNGLTLAGSGAVARQPKWLCLQYDDAFSNDLALRLARRLFAAISTRQCFAEMVDHDDNLEETGRDLDVLQTLLTQLDFLNIESEILHFQKHERDVHESRVSTLLLDWARTVMLQEWDGRPEISLDSPFGGALSLIAAMYGKRQSLLLGDIQFRVDYFADRLDSINMPISWLSFTSTKHKSHMLDFPYIFNPSTLVSYFRSINFSRMSRSYEESSSLQTRMKAIVAQGGLITNAHHKFVLQDLLKTASSKYLILDISRKNVVRDAFDQLWQREDRELHRPLKVHLGEEGGEEGFDSGGVQQEFFRLAIAECLNPDYNAFTVDDRTRMTWFVPGSIVPVWKFEILGLLVSLAVYNGLTLPITFPKALYRKLLGEPVNELHHIADGWPDLASGLTTLLEWDEKDGLVEDIFARTYEFSVSMFDQPISREMNTSNPKWPQLTAVSDEPLAASNPPDAPLVTNENRNAYVSDYIRYLTDVSVQPQYEAFERGFRACLHQKSLQLLSPSLLQSVVEGIQEIDIADLRRYTRYVGWDASHRSVKDFWSIVKRYDDRMKRRLLEFVTASDRVPVGGMKNLQFVVQRNGEEDGEGGHLPTAYTCYGTLLLPEYKDKEVLRERLGMALENSQGFGFA